MMGATHRLFGAYVGAGVTFVLDQPLQHVAITAGIASVFAAGALSPDVDNYPAWKTLDRFIPDELLGEGGPMQHRGITHFWGNVAIMSLLVAIGQQLHPAPWWFLAWAVLLGWASHIVGDFLVGGKVWGSDGPGIPLMPWWNHVGTGFLCEGKFETVLRWLMALPLIPFAAFLKINRERTVR